MSESMSSNTTVVLNNFFVANGVGTRGAAALAAHAAVIAPSEPELADRAKALRGRFSELFGGVAELCIRSPGRAEILGNHTDYNSGYALACCISRSVLALFRKRTDGKVRVLSAAFPDQEVLFDVKSMSKHPTMKWGNYVAAVVNELVKSGVVVTGADVLVESTVPSSGGVSSSAAFELALALGFSALMNDKLTSLDAALLCKRAENGEFVGTPCGLLDQAAVALGESGKMVFLDFKPTNHLPISTRIVCAKKALQGYSFVITVDPEVKRNLGETGYPARRKMCEDSLPILSALLNRAVESLREVSIEDFNSVKASVIERGGQVMCDRVEHIVYENQRVLDGAAALQSGDVSQFGKILSASGHSAIELYGLDEKTPELTNLLNFERQAPNVVGTRNMGGGFSAITLSLLKTDDVAAFSAHVATSYRAKYKRELQFIEFQSTNGAEILP